MSAKSAAKVVTNPVAVTAAGEDATGNDAEAAPSAGVATSVSGSAPPDDFLYHLDAVERATIVNAQTSKDVPLKLRNKVYAALKRFLDAGKMNSSVAEEWACRGKGPLLEV